MPSLPPAPTTPAHPELYAAVATLVAVLASCASVLALVPRAAFHMDFALQAVVLTMSLMRTEREARLPERAWGLLVLPAVAAALAVVHAQLFHLPLADDVFLAALVGLAVWVRRLGPVATRMGTTAILPVVAILVVRGAATHPDPDYAQWMGLAALVSALWVFVVLWLGGWLGLVRPSGAPVAPPATAVAGKLFPSTRVALQMGVALLLAGVLGRWVFAEHGAWVSLTAFIVCSGARGTADVVHKALLRVAGAAVGTALGTLLASALGQHHMGSLVAIAVVMTAASALRSRNYGFWAAGVTLSLALLYGWQGGATGALLFTRMAAIALGAVLGMACTALLWPLRTQDIARKRLADALALLAELLAPAVPDATQTAARFRNAVALLMQVAPALRTHHVLWKTVQPGTTRMADALEALHNCLEPVHTLVQAEADADAAGSKAQLLARINAVRRAIGLRPEAYAHCPVALVIAPSASPTQLALGQIDSAVERLRVVFLG